jgi:dolichyl-phosphate-mannose-protein mannosyltransferase
MNEPQSGTSRPASLSGWLAKAEQLVFGPDRLSRVDAWLLLLSVLMIAVGVASRFWDIGFPPRFSFDEEHFVINARNYVAGIKDANDHPPLGKLLIAVGMLMLEDHTVGWRIVPLIFGLQSIVLAYYLGKHLFEDPRAGLLAALLISTDGFFIAYSRTALLDGMLLSLMLWSALAMVVARSAWGVAIAAVLAGLAASVKWTGGLMVIPFALWIVVLNRYPWYWLLLLGLVPFVHIGVWSAALAITAEPASVGSVLGIMRDLLGHHLNRSTVTHPELSRWYTWPILLDPITLNSQHEGLRVRTSSTVGNPLLWWSTSLTVLAAALAIALRLIPITRQWLDRHVWGTRAGEIGLSLRAVAFALACYLSPFLPWILSRRDSYMYHYLPMYGFGMVLIAGVVAWAFRRWRRVTWAFVIAIAAMSLYFIPTSSEIPLSHRQFERRLVFDRWK